jgi:Pyruvate/2-oxoacid:ferredoxin oxidoreductase delta subunit
MVKRKIIKIDESKCDGCALCIPNCPEGALQIIDGKAKLVKQSFCDGLGACLGNCPQDALHVVEALADDYDEKSVFEYIRNNSPDKIEAHIEHLRENRYKVPIKQQGFSSCPSSRVMQFESKPPADLNTNFESQLRQWPIQLHLVPPAAPYFNTSDLVLVADCVPFAYANFHNDFLDGHSIAIACPKLDDISPYVEKLVNIFRTSDIKSLTVVIMEVPCCSGLLRLAVDAARNSGTDFPIEVVTVGIKGSVLGRKTL